MNLCMEWYDITDVADGFQFSASEKSWCESLFEFYSLALALAQGFPLYQDGTLSFEASVVFSQQRLDLQ